MSLVLILSVGLGSAVCASETFGGIEAPQSSAWMHSDGDGDEVPRDAEKGYPHHHVSCHCDHLSVPDFLGSATRIPIVRVMPAAWGDETVSPVATDPALRPPQA